MALTDYFGKEKRQYKRGAAWTRKAGKNPTGGLNAEGRASYSNPGANLLPQLPNLTLRVREPVDVNHSAHACVG